MSRLALLASFALVLGCPSVSPDPDPEPTPAEPPFPSMIMRHRHKALILDRIARAPYDAVLADVQATALEEYEAPDPEVWSASIHGRNAERAQAHALLAWLFDDEAEAVAARAGLDLLDSDWDSNTVWDINIRMPHPLMGYVNAWDLLRATPWLPDDEAARLERSLTLITGQFFDQYVEDDGVRALVLGQAQNNHPIRTAAAIGYVAMAFPDNPGSDRWADWAFSELDYLWGPEGRYVQEGGGVSEGPFYFGFAWGVSAAYFIAADNLYGAASVERLRDCRNRNDSDPWAPIACVDGEPFTVANPLRTAWFQDTVTWSQRLALPWGSRPPLADAYLNPFNGASLLSSFGGDGTFAWDWLRNRDRPLEMHHGADLAAHHLAYYDDGVAAVAPVELDHYSVPSGTAVGRSAWDHDALWTLLVAESGPARKTLHDHVDGTSFTLAAHGEYLLIDPGYYKPNDLDNAVTAHSPSHNVVLIDGRAAPNKGLLTNWGDADAELIGHVRHGDGDWAFAARQTYQETTVTRAVVAVRGRLVVVLDLLDASSTTPREHRWRLHGHAGFESGGTFALEGDGARWVRPSGVGVGVRLASTAPGLAIEEPPFNANAAPHVGQFALDRSVGHHAVMDGRVEAVEPDFVALIDPWAAGEERLEIEEIADPAGPRFVVHLAGEDVEVWLRDGEGTVSTADYTLVVTPDGLEAR